MRTSNMLTAVIIVTCTVMYTTTSTSNGCMQTVAIPATCFYYIIKPKKVNIPHQQNLKYTYNTYQFKIYSFKVTLLTSKSFVLLCHICKLTRNCTQVGLQLTARLDMTKLLCCVGWCELSQWDSLNTSSVIIQFTSFTWHFCRVLAGSLNSVLVKLLVLI